MASQLKLLQQCAARIFCRELTAGGSKKMRKLVLWIVLILAIIAATTWGLIVSNVEQAKYEVVETHGNIQIRDYSPMIVAETEVSGERKEAIKQGFRTIADYIFGNNLSKQKIAMTAPVIQQPSEKIFIAAPATHQEMSNQWTVRFMMPSVYTLNTLPKPNNDAVKLKQILGKRFVVIRFSGIAGENSLKEHSDLLIKYIADNHLSIVSQPIYGFFNPPWTLPFLRRNEVMIEVVK